MSHTRIEMLKEERKKTNHVLHLIMTLFTGGLWIIPWVIFGVTNYTYNSVIDKEIKKEYERILIQEQS